MFSIWISKGIWREEECTQLEPLTSRHRNCIGSVRIDGRTILKRIIGRYVVTIYICVCVLESYDPVADLVKKVMNFQGFTEKLPGIHCAAKTIMS
jgi:hypothetical protein